VIGIAVAQEVVGTSPASAGNASTGASDAVARPASQASLTARAVTAANAFKASLSAAQRAALQYAFNSSKKQSGWSNLPTTFVKRNGVAVKDLSAAQLAKLRTLLTTILSTQGYADEEAVRKADTYLSQQPNSGGGGPIADTPARTARACTGSSSSAPPPGRRSGPSSSEATTTRST
jgi:Protein of unknown function (DUF3500)